MSVVSICTHITIAAWKEIKQITIPAMSAEKVAVIVSLNLASRIGFYLYLYMCFDRISVII